MHKRHHPPPPPPPPPRKVRARRGESRSWVQRQDCCCCCCWARVAMAASTLKCGACSFVDAVVVKNASASLRPSAAAAAPVVSQVGSVAGVGGSPVWKSTSWAGVSLVARPSGEEKKKKKMVKYVKRTVVSQAVSIETEKEVEHLNIAEDVTQVHIRFLFFFFFLDAFGLLLLLVFCLFLTSERR